MRTLLFGLIFGLLAVGHSSPITNVTQVPTKAEDDILQAVTDGFLVDFHGFTSETPERNTTDPPPQPTPTVPYEKDFEGSASGESGDLFPLHVGDHVTSTATTNTTTTTKPKAAQETSTALVSVPDFEGSASGESIPLFPFREVGHSSATPTTTTTITTAAPKDAPPESGEKAPEGKASVESGDMDPLDEVRSTPTPTLAAPVGPRGSRMFGINKESGSEEDLTNTDTKTGESPAPVNTDKDSRSIFINNEPQKGNTEMHKGHTTPGWIIIVAFIVGLAALIMICVAIATRDKWNRPNQAPPLENNTNTNSTNQQKEQEMETFLPKENGKSSEYTVIPLDELPEKYSSD